VNREWQKGDLATGRIVEWSGRLIYVGGGTWFDEDGNEWSDEALEDLRPLVSVDPDDATEVTRLDNEVQRFIDDPNQPTNLGTADLMAMALRSFSTPPKPVEPTNVGAVVEDMHGRIWYLRSPALEPYRWACWDVSAYTRAYAEVPAVRVLSEGVVLP